ncbi:hypothetical protein AJ79_10088, partial [Helicocarpus griseus UAMH5409]
VQDTVNSIANTLNEVSLRLSSSLDQLFHGSIMQVELNARCENQLDQLLQAREHQSVKQSQHHIKIGLSGVGGLGIMNVKDTKHHIDERKAAEVRRTMNSLQRRTRAELKKLRKKLKDGEDIDDIGNEMPSDKEEPLFIIDKEGIIE